MTEGSANPFLDDIFVDHPDLLPGALRVHHDAFQSIVAAVESMAAGFDRLTPADSIGRTILITAPRAGYGKTHFAARLRRHLKSSATTLSLNLDPSRPITWPIALSSTLRQFLNEPGRRSSESCLFAESGKFLLSQVILSHRNKGSLKPGQCPATDESLRSEFSSLFEVGSELLSWTDAQSRDLARRADGSFLHALGLSASDLGFWTRLILDFIIRGEAALEPLRGLSNGEARERLLQWLRIATFYRPNLIIADGLDGFFESPSAGMEIAALITGIRESVPRSLTLVCLNEDIWKSVFEDKLPSAWLDRLTGETEKLRAISPEAAEDLIAARLKNTPLSELMVTRFVERLKSDHLWIDSMTKLYPRSVIHQARTLWEKESATFLKAEKTGGTDEVGKLAPLSEITDKVAFFTALAEDRPASPTVSKEASPEPPAPVLPPTPETRESPVGNPFFAPPGNGRDSKLVGIDSIINDIRGSGRTVRSESASPESGFIPPASPAVTPPASPAVIPPPAESGWLAGKLNIRSLSANEPADGFGFSSLTPPEQKAMTPPPLPIAKAPDWARLLKEKESAFATSPDLKLNLEWVEEFIRSIGTQHPGLSQSEERFPSSRTVCVRWNVRGESVLLGFESPQNVYFWNNLLQQSLASNRREKLAAFSHRTDRFDPGLFSSFGFSPTVTRDRIDVIEMNDRELSMIYAAREIMEQSRGTDEAPAAVQIAIRYLDPLWRRISKPIQ